MFGVEDFSKSIVDLANFNIEQLGTALIFGAVIVLIGMITIFSVLSIIWVCLVLLKLAFNDLPARRAKAKATVEVAPAPVVVAKQTNDEEIVAVIAAAIAMAESESSGIKFRVVSFKRK